MAGATLVVELFTEELPPKALKALGQAFSDRLAQALTAAQLAPSDAAVTSYATPRRLGVSIAGVVERAPDRVETKKLMPARVAYDANGAPTPALAKRLEKEGAQAADLSTRAEAGIDHVWLEQSRAGLTLAAGLQLALDETIAKLPIPKRMKYQRRIEGGGDEGGVEATVEFVRPAHGIVALHDHDVVDVRALGLRAGRITGGHRFLGMRHVSIASADRYASTLRDDGKVVAGFAERRTAIMAELARCAGDDRVVMPDALLDEVTALVEWPAVYRGTFDASFLDVPQECLILTMQQNQKYFALTDASGRLVNCFLVVSNIQTDEPSRIVEGNERVLRARLADAKFFFDQDRKRTLASRVEQLKAIVYHNKLGTQYERVERVASLAARIAPMVGADGDDAARAARLAKADLVTDMVGEFPELQGLMGCYYAQHDGEKPDVAQAIEEQYRPRFAGDALPHTPTGTCLALADKLESLTDMFGIGAFPTGDKDPFALRRAALGVVRIVIEKRLPVSLDDLIDKQKGNWSDLREFILDRARTWLIDQGLSSKAVDSTRDLQWASPLSTVADIVREASSFIATPEGRQLAEANKRISNILRKAGDDRVPPMGISPRSLQSKPDVALFTEEAERRFWEALTDIGERSLKLREDQRFAESLRLLTSLASPTARFFDDVMVNADDPAVRENRLTLLQHARAYMNQVAELSAMAD